MLTDPFKQFPNSHVCLSLTEHKGLLQEAKLELKKSKRKDYYKILSLSMNCTDSEVKKAYRREALKHHPGMIEALLTVYTTAGMFFTYETVNTTYSEWKHPCMRFKS